MRHGIMTKIAAEVGVTPKYIGDIFSLRRRPSPSLAVKLEEVTGISRNVWVFEPERLREMLAR